MASSTGYDNDEYVAKLLAEDAKKTSLRYAQQGLSGLLPRRPTGAAPKPNTRFLKNLVREADSHNAALKKKEELEARIRQQELNERERNRCGKDGYRDADQRPLKRRRYDNEDDYRQRRRTNDDRDYGRLNISPERSRSRERRHDRSRRARDESATKSQVGHTLERERRLRSRSFSDSRTVEMRHQGKTEERRRRRKDRSKERRHHIRSTGSEASEDEKRFNREQNSRRHSDNDASDSDPLETLVGPLEKSRENITTKEKPPIRSKGRGAYKPSGAAMDAHFSSSYNSGIDLHPESEVEEEKEDWDMALEALRDREMFKQKHAERLREAGFGDADIKKWEASGKEKDVEDVKWTGKGQAREWDIGKVIDDDR